MNNQWTEEFGLAYKFITETNTNVFLTGKAGTGKTTFLKYIRENSGKNIAIGAPTGVAAINAGGVTLHSMFQLPFIPFIPSNIQTNLGFDKKTLLSRVRFNSQKIAFFNSLELLVIDEASMVASHTIDAIDTILRSVRHNQLPFGGVQTLFIGDLYQLQPVFKKEEWEFLKDYYSSIFFFDSHVLRENVPVMIELKKIFRQKDQHFIEILNGIRENSLTKDHLTELNKKLNRNFTSSEEDNYITLTTHNNQANLINESKLNRLKTREYKFKATIEGEFPDHMIPADKELVLKEGSQVMFIKNDVETKKYFNGKIGVITDISDDEIIVQTDEEKIIVKEHVWENITYAVDPETKQIKETVIGTFTQYPLRLAWAITIHKSQGLTFDKLIIDAENAFANGQVYVALSRARSLDGLVLTSPVNDRFLGAHSDLINWQEKNHDEKLLPARFEKAKNDFIEHEVFGLFNFSKLSRSLNDLRKELREAEPFDEIPQWMEKLNVKIHSQISTANKFRSELEKIIDENRSIDSNEKLQSRIRDASKYFYNQFEESRIILFNHPIKITNRRLSRKIDKLLEGFDEIVVQIITKMKLCFDGFHFTELLAWKKTLPSSPEKIKSTYISHSDKSKPQEQSELYDRLIEFRKEVAEEKDLPLYMVFGNSAIKNFCEMLPGDKQSMLAVSGLGKSKIDQYGDELLRIINEYSEEFDLKLNHISESEQKKISQDKATALSETVMKTIVMYISGKNIFEISEERTLAASTIENHLATGIKHKLVDIEKILPNEELEKIKSFFSNNSVDLKTAREKSGNEFSYGKLRMVQAWLMSGRA